jgi:acyl-CoA synthetase (AMP-forming)/AMP-acid ligase II
MSTLGEGLAATAARRGPVSALFFDGVAYSYQVIAQRAAAVAGSLHQRGVGPGDRVAVGLANSPELVVAVLGVIQSGAVLVPLNPASSGDELLHIVRDCGARLALVEPDHAAALRRAALRELAVIATAADVLSGAAMPPADVDAAAPALIIYTSGTTGRPKGAVLSHRALLGNLTTVAQAWQWSEHDRLLLTLPCFHLHGLGLGILTSFLVGSSVVLRRRFVAEEIVTDLERSQATMFFGVPTMYNRLAALPKPVLQGHDLHRMRLWVSGSAPLSTATFERFRERFGYSLMDRYGMTECGFVLSTAYAQPRRPGVVGRPLPGIEVRLIDADQADAGRMVDVAQGAQGEIAIKGPNLFAGYWNRPDDTRRAVLDGYLRSGDLALREADGQFRIVGRSSVDIIKTRGFKVSAVEIEDCLQRHPQVQEVAVVGLPDADQGERLIAAVTAKPESAVTEEELRTFARAHLAPHKVPSRLVFVDEIPRTGPGKFKKKELIAQLTARRMG